jgi:hypothetical protein
MAFTMTEFNIIDYGAKSDPQFNNAKAIQAAIDACDVAGGGIIIIPAGQTYYTGPFILKSNLNFHVEGGASVIAYPAEELYQLSAFRENRGEGMMWISANGQDNIMITGQGRIDGNAIAFMGKEEKSAFELKPITNFDPRPHILTLINCNNVTIRDITIANSAYWCVHLAGCQDIVISGVRILNNLKVRNSDGIDLDHSKNVRISDCYITSGDDCICFKNRREYAEYGACENITVTNCIMTSTSCAIKIGSENMDVIRNLIITNCIIKASNRGLGIQNRDEGIVENIIFENIQMELRLFDDIWWGKAEPIYITALKRAPSNTKDANWRFAKGQTIGNVGKISNIYFRNIHAISENGIFITGEHHKIENIIFEHVFLKINKHTKYRSGVYDRRPCEIQGIIQGNTAGFYIDTAKKITILNSQVEWGLNSPLYYSNVLIARNTFHLHISELHGTAAQIGELAIILDEYTQSNMNKA